MSLLLKASESASSTTETALVSEAESGNDHSTDEIVKVGFTKTGGTNCPCCQAEEEKAIGSPFLEIAEEYENNAKNIDKLAVKMNENERAYGMTFHEHFLKDAKAMVA